jgi:hypothetical protein
MKLKMHKNGLVMIMFVGIIWEALACQKVTTAPSVSGVASFTVVNVIPNTVYNVIPVINTAQAIMWYQSAYSIGYGSFYEYSPISGNDTIYVVQSNDTLHTGPKALGEMFYGILPLKSGGIYSLFLCGTDTTSPDYLFTTDTLPYYSPVDSVTGIRFVNLSTGSNPISINLEGSPYGSAVSSLAYKNITDFKQYIDNSTISDYLFVVRDVATGDSLTQFDFIASGSGNNGYGLTDAYNNGKLLTFRNITIAIYGSETDQGDPLTTMLIDDY